MEKIVTVVGARPQFVKVAAGSRQIRKNYNEVLVHTGQHFDANMSDIFFREMGIPKPDYNLGVSGGSHAEMTAKMMVGIEGVLLKEKPDALLVYGDTNSTLAASLAAVKLQIPVFHVESGNRLGTLDNPEEANRIATDHLSRLRFCATESTLENLKKEGLEDGSFFVGNIMLDSFYHYSRKPWKKKSIVNIDGQEVALPKKYYYMTCHRQENTYSDAPIIEILSAMDSLDAPTIYPVHPRNREQVKKICEDKKYKNIICVQPVGYIDSIHLVNNAEKVVTDSGGLQCEAFYAGTQCIFVFDHAAWPETMVGNRNQLAKADHNDILKKLSAEQTIDSSYQPFGDGHAAEKICNIIDKWSEGRL